jgi:pilus assembly protein Flp/PilA
VIRRAVTFVSFLYTEPEKGKLVMQTFKNAVVNFMKREDGPTAVEYAVMLALIIVVCITAITALGTNANKTFTSVSNTIGGTGS